MDLGKSLELMKECLEVAIKQGYTKEQAIECKIGKPLGCPNCPLGFDNPVRVKL